MVFMDISGSSSLMSPPATVGGWQKQRALFVAVPPKLDLKSVADK